MCIEEGPLARPLLVLVLAFMGMADTPTDLATLPLVFDRRRAKHGWLRAFSELETRDDGWQHVVESWRMDHRVSPAREEEMLAAAELAGEPDGETWLVQRRRYFERALCRPSWPEPGGVRAVYLEPSNDGNALPQRLIPPHEQLIHAASLNAILWRLSSAELPGALDLKLRFEELTDRPFPERPLGGGFYDRAGFDAQVDEIATAVNARGADAIQGLGGALCEALGESQPPWWASFAQELMRYLQAEDWTGLCQALGMGHLEAGAWLIVWRYEVAVPARRYARTLPADGRGSREQPVSLPVATGLPLRHHHVAGAGWYAGVSGGSAPAVSSRPRAPQLHGQVG